MADMTLLLRLLGAALPLTLATPLACQTGGDAAGLRGLDGGDLVLTTVERPGFCVTLRGDDGRVVAQAAALARLIDHGGLPGALAGSTSGGITLQVADAILANPAVRVCGDAPCSPVEIGERTSLLLRSLEAYTLFVGKLPDQRQAKAIASFYAGRSDAADLGSWSTFLNECSTNGRGASWAEIYGLPAGTTTCGQQFLQMLKRYETRAATEKTATDTAAWSGRSLPLVTGLAAGQTTDAALTQGLRGLGCESVVYVTRRDPKPLPATTVAAPQADAFWCTDWRAFKEQQIRELAQNAGDAPLQLQPGGQLPPGLSSYPRLAAGAATGGGPTLPGCGPP